MSNAVSALDGEVFNGFCSVTDRGPAGMLTLRGDFSDAGFSKALKTVSGGALPKQLKIVMHDDVSVGWMSPDERLLLCTYEASDRIAAKLAKALGKRHSLVANVSDARALIRVEGPSVRDVLAKLTPANVGQDVFQPGDFRRSRLAQVPAAFWMVDDETVDIVCFRSVARYVFDVLKGAAQPGSEVH